MITEFEKNRLETFFAAGARNVIELPEHWLHNSDDESFSYCLNCAIKELEKPGNEDCDLDGGYDIFDNDSTPFCEICHARLETRLTVYGIEYELDYYSVIAFNPYSNDNCLDFLNIIESGGWDNADFQRICRKIIDKHFWIMPCDGFRHMWG